MILLKCFLIFIFFVLSLNITAFSQNVNIADTNILEQNIEAGFHIPINIWVLNTAEDDFAPCFIASTNEFYYNSITNDYSKYFVSYPQISKDSLQTSYHNVLFSHNKQLNSPLNQHNKNRAYFSIINNNLQKCAFVNASTHYPTGNYVNIHKTIFERNTWSQPTLIIELGGECFVGYPTVSPDGDMLIFSSNKNSNDGTIDLWIAFMNNEQNWDMMAPIDELNSIGNEITPHFVSNSLLLFASDGFDGNGGYDLYYSIYSDGKWTKPTPLEDINTEFNETDPATLMSNYLVFASNRPGGKGKLDLYITTVKLQDTIAQPNYELSIAATNYSLDITKILSYEVISDSAKTISNNEMLDWKPNTIFNIAPQNIEFTITTDSMLNKLDLYYTIACAQQILDTGYINFANETSANWIIDFSKWSSSIFNADTVILNIYHQHDLLKSLPIETIKTENKEIKKHNEQKQNYYKIITAFANNITDFLDINSDVINDISELTRNNKNIEISIPQVDNVNKILGEIKKHFQITKKNNVTFTTAGSQLIIFKVII